MTSTTNLMLGLHDDDDDDEEVEGDMRPSSSIMPHPCFLHDLVEAGKNEELAALFESIRAQKDYNPDGEIDIDEEDCWDCTALHVALTSYNVEGMKILLKNGAEAQIPCEGNPLLHVAISLGVTAKHIPDAIDAIRVLMEGGKCDIDCHGKSF